MKNRKLLILIMLLSVLGITSCRSVYPQPEFAKFAKPPVPHAVLKEFREKALTECTVFQKAVIDIKGRKMAALGLCSIDAEQKYIALSLISTTGIKLIEFAEHNGVRRSSFVFSDIATGDQAAKRIGDDIKRIYIHPNGDPLFNESTENAVILIWDKGDIRTELRFGKSSKEDIGKTLLLEKKIFIDDTLEGVVYYYDYKKINEKISPMRIHYKNKKYDYSLTLKTNEVVDGEKKKSNKK